MSGKSNVRRVSRPARRHVDTPVSESPLAGDAPGRKLKDRSSQEPAHPSVTMHIGPHTTPSFPIATTDGPVFMGFKYFSPRSGMGWQSNPGRSTTFDAVGPARNASAWMSRDDMSAGLGTDGDSPCITRARARTTTRHIIDVALSSSTSHRRISAGPRSQATNARPRPRVDRRNGSDFRIWFLLNIIHRRRGVCHCSPLAGCRSRNRQV